GPQGGGFAFIRDSGSAFHSNRDLATIRVCRPDSVQTIAILLAQAAPSLSRSQLRWEFLNIAAAIALISVALVAILLFFFRRQTRDLTLIYFSLFCILYAVRLLAATRIFRSLFDYPPRFWAYLTWDLTCTILIPFGLFFYRVSSEFLRKYFR